MTRIAALDGLRTVAIAVVVVYHVDKDVLPAGHWGVPLFFVLSGFVITASLCAEIDRTGRLDLGAFYRKRLLRIVPALAVVCLALLAIGTAWSQVAPSIGLYANYARIEGVSLGRLTHTWFVAVIAQFYLVWPLVIAAIPARRRTMALGALAVAAIVWRVVAIEIMSPGWVYNSTDTNAAGLFVGAFLAVAGIRARRVTVAWSLPVLLGLMLLPVFGDSGRLVLWGGFLAVALSALVLLYAATGPAWLENRVLLRIAEVSFGIYLWHYVFVRSDIPLWAAALGTALATAASWWLVERPLVRWDAARRSRRSEPGRWRLPTPSPAVVE
ncbi:MAG: acyltransferase [Actinomycetota bacterium]